MSVVIPTRNRPGVLPRAVASVLSQTASDLEVIVVDDGSQPPVDRGTLPPDPRVRLLRLNRSGGAARARNVGMSAGNGAWFAFLDDDDRWRPDKLELQLEAMRREGTDWAACGYTLWEEPGLGSAVAQHHPPPSETLQATMLETCGLQTSTVVVARSLVDRVGPMPEVDRIEDWLWLLDLVDLSPPSILGLPLVERSIHHVDPAVQRTAHANFVERIERRLRRLDPEAADRIHARHAFHLAVYDAKAGRRRSARRQLLSLWLHRPSDLRPLLHALRTVIGERWWRLLADLAARASREEPSRHVAGQRTLGYRDTQQ